MGAKLCVLCHLIRYKNSKSSSARDGNSLKKEKQGRFCKILKQEMETEEKKVPKVTLEEWILGSPGLKPDYLYACKQSKKKVHPCVSQLRGSLIDEAKDSLCLDRPMNKEGEELLSCSSIGRSLSGKSEKRVSFKLPHVVIFYTPDEPCLQEEHEAYYSSESEGSFYSSICGENSFDSSAEEPFFRLAVDILPHVFVSSKI